ncbi:MAG TPA: LpxD N-terminal domain-containing protein, partial [Candidatus Polarisedimenticolaceae bacterium]|nr:LpxD N-terminal domain-containing protein [Candidatus Polarisedimenticolaceae bacterium]
MSRGFRLEELARCVGGTVVGDPTVVLHGVATLDAATPDQISFLINPRYRRLAQTTRAGAIIAKPGAGVAGR